MNSRANPLDFKKESNMKKHIVLAACLAAGTVTGAMAQSSGDGPWLVRARAVSLDMAIKDSTGLGLNVNNKNIPEVDVSYFFSPNIAVELVLTVPQKQTVHSSVLAADLGTFKHLPPTLLVQYHFTDLQGCKPYLGVGINYTKLTHVNLSTADAELNPVTLESHSWGGALQAGVDIPLDKNWSINLDLKKVFIKSRVDAAGASVGTLKLDPLMAGVGIGYRF